MGFHFYETINFFLIVIQSSSIYLVRMCVLSHFSHIQLFVTLWIVACQAPLSMGFSRQEHWSGLHIQQVQADFFHFLFLFWRLISFISFASIFFHFEGCPFISFMVFFAVQKLLSLIRPHLFIFVLIFITVEGRSKKILR